MAAPRIPKVGIKLKAAINVTESPISEAYRLYFGLPVPEKKFAKMVCAEKKTIPGEISKMMGRISANSSENNSSKKVVGSRQITNKAVNVSKIESFMKRKVSCEARFLFSVLLKAENATKPMLCPTMFTPSVTCVPEA